MDETRVKIIRVSHLPYPDGPAAAAVTLAYGQVVIRALLMKGPDGLFLSLPARRTTDGRWLELTFFRDANIHREAQRQALKAYRALPPISESLPRRNLSTRPCCNDQKKGYTGDEPGGNLDNFGRDYYNQVGPPTTSWKDRKE